MGQPLFEVLKPGLYTTVQDLGRTGFQKYGMAISGAMDPLALQIANILVGNPRHEAALEITLKGPCLRLLSDALLAIAGADLSLDLNGRSIQPWQSFLAKKGQILSFGAPKKGMRAYLAVYGGFDLPKIMGSKSTYVLGQTGGLNGRPLKKGDVLNGTKQIKEHKGVTHRLAPKHVPHYPDHSQIRVIWGPEKDAFSPDSIEIFLSHWYQITPDANRMGYRLSGPNLLPQEGQGEILSSAVTRGTIQVPPDGQPIILMADSQTTGGYPRLANVVSVDLPVLAQLGPGQSLSFTAVNVDEAHRLYRNQENFLRLLSVARGSHRYTDT
jgi:antagonist of KipI